jgi:hypothetical protein
VLGFWSRYIKLASEDAVYTMQLNSSMCFNFGGYFEILFVSIETLCPSPEQEKRKRPSVAFRNISCGKYSMRSIYISAVIGAR